MHAWTSTWVALVSMLLYTVCNASLRHLGDLQAPIEWSITVKETVAVVFLAPWIFFRLLRRRYRFQSKRLFLLLLVGALICQVIGSQNQLFAYAVVGLIIATPTLQACQLTATALIGKYALKDSISRSQWGAMALLLIAVLLLSLGKSADLTTFVENGSTIRTLQGIGASALAALAFATYFNIVRYLMRKHRNHSLGAWESIRIHDWVGHNLATHPSQERRYSPFPITLLMITVTGVGVLYYAPVVFLTRGGWEGFTNVPKECWFWACLAGVTNLVGFFFQIQALLLASATKMSLIAAFQIVTFAVLGILFFGESMNMLIAVGVAFAIVGVFFSSQEAKSNR
ncbi:MAG: DMT family transporter [Planctomycetaceae bacterium]|nr:DMT family transporter [Planctomycetaceae bacterium]